MWINRKGTPPPPPAVSCGKQDWCRAGIKPKVQGGAAVPPPPQRSPHRNSVVAKLAAARGHGSKRLAGQPAESVSPPKAKRQRAGRGGEEGREVAEKSAGGSEVILHGLHMLAAG